MRIRTLALAAALLSPAAALRAAGTNGFSMEVLVDGAPQRELYGRGKVYVEALRERPYAVRLTNPLGVRVGVALSVDGRNTIDAKRTAAGEAAKWVLEPYESVVISGWQVDGATARRFTFTTEKKSYAAWLGDLSNAGVIEAVFYRERAPMPRPMTHQESGAIPPAAAAPRDSAAREPQGAMKSEIAGDYAATGMGDATEHRVTEVDLRLEKRPAAHLRIRYEFRDQLAALGVLPREEVPPSRRERATGFSSYCPQPPRW